MKQPKRIMLAGLLLAALGGFMWLVLRSSEPEPAYQGKPLSFWLQGYVSGNSNITHPKGPPPPTRQEADEAVGQIGANAIPTLLRMLQRDSELEVEIMSLLRMHHFTNLSFVHEMRKATAYPGFMRLRSKASNAVPQLVEVFESDPSPYAQRAIPLIFGSIGPAAAPAIPAMLRTILGMNGIMRNNALFALGKIHAEPELVVPALMKCLNDPNAFVRAQAAFSLGEFGSAARSAVPALVELLRTKSLGSASGSRPYIVTPAGSSWSRLTLAPSGSTLSSVTKDALLAIDPEAAAKAGVK